MKGWLQACRVHARHGRVAEGMVHHRKASTLLSRAELKDLSKGVFNVQQALQIVKTQARAKFDESVDVSLELGLDPRKPNQSIRALLSLPHGTGKKLRIAVFAEGDKAEEARSAGADIVGLENLLADIEKGQIDFNRAIATPDCMPKLRSVARILGPKGLMPNAKLGTVTDDIAEVVSRSKKGSCTIRNDRYGIVRAGIGKVSFDLQQLEDNLRAFMIGVATNKPEGAKGKFFLACTLSSTQGKIGVPIHPRYIDPNSIIFMVDNDDATSIKPVSE